MTGQISQQTKKKLQVPSNWPANEEPVAQQLHPAILGWVAGLYAYMLGVYWLLFIGKQDVAFMLAVSTVFFIMYGGLPLTMARTGQVSTEGTRLSDFLNGKFATYTGPISGRSAMIQVLTIPASLCLAVTGIAVAIARTM